MILRRLMNGMAWLACCLCLCMYSCTEMHKNIIENMQVDKDGCELVLFEIHAADNAHVLTEDVQGVINDDTIFVNLTHTVASLRLKTEMLFAGMDLKLMCNDTEVKLDKYTTIDLSKSNSIIIYGKNGAERSYVIAVKVNNGIPVVFIDTDNDQAIDSKEVYVNGRMRVDGVEMVPSMVADMRIRGRGNSTWAMPKKPYRIKLDKKLEVAGMPAHKDWVLLANYIDPSLVKNAIGFKLSDILGMEWSSRNVNVDVYVNGAYEGNYLLCEQIKIDKNRVNIASLKDGDTDEVGITGGYLLELDVYFDEEQKFKTELRGLPVMVKDPELNAAQLNWIEGYFNEVERVLYGDDFASATNGYRNFIDTESFIKWWLVQELMSNWEPNHPKSTFMTKDRGGKLKMGPVWDFDWYIVCNSPVEGFMIKGSLWYNRLFKDRVFVEQTKMIWNEKKETLKDELTAFLTHKRSELAISGRLNDERWPKENHTEDVKSHGESIEGIINYFEGRIAWMDGAINSL